MMRAGFDCRRRQALPRAIALFLAMILVGPGCGTPADVKTLSTAQLGYFDTAIAAVRVQSEALLIAAETIKQQAEAEIDAELKKAQSEIANTVARTVPDMPPSARLDTVTRLLEAATPATEAAYQSKARLEARLQSIRTRSEELAAALQQMKEVQLAIDAYLQSEQAGERVTQAILGSPGVQDLLSRAGAVTNTVRMRSNELLQLIGELRPQGEPP